VRSTQEEEEEEEGKDAQQTEAGLLNKSSCLAPALDVIKFIIDTDMIWVTLCCAT
jgi:hypothetical protein